MAKGDEVAYVVRMDVVVGWHKDDFDGDPKGWAARKQGLTDAEAAAAISITWPETLRLMEFAKITAVEELNV